MNSKWTDFHNMKIQGNYPSWPVEAMVKVLFGKYLKNPMVLESGMKVLDIGCGFGNNLMPFHMKGMECHGVEISQSVVDVTRKALDHKGASAVVLSVGHNRSIPYADNFFDLIVSNNVIHYENSEDRILDALGEYKRVLKPGGVLFLMTAGPEHEIYRRAKVVGPHLYQIQNYDFRDGEIYFYFDSQKYLDSYLSRFFQTVETGRVTEQLMTLPLDFLVGVARKASS